MTFAALGCSEALLAALAKRGFETPMPVQAQTIQPGLEGRDLLVQSRTGSGKTLAFGLPLLQRLTGERHAQALILAPTRELAQQATLETRRNKHEPRSHADQRATWRGEAVAVLGGERRLAGFIRAALSPARADVVERQRVTDKWVRDTAGEVLTAVSASRAVWQENHIRAEAERRPPASTGDARSARRESTSR